MDQDDFEQFYIASYQRLLWELFAVTGGDLPEAEDALQEAYVRASLHWQRIRSYQAPGPPPSPGSAGRRAHTSIVKRVGVPCGLACDPIGIRPARRKAVKGRASPCEKDPPTGVRSCVCAGRPGPSGTKLGVLTHGRSRRRGCVPILKRSVADLAEAAVRHIVAYQPIVSDCFGCEDTACCACPGPT